MILRIHALTFIRSVFNKLTKMNRPNVNMQYHSMYMNNSYEVDIEEEANIVRVGTKKFGRRKD